MRDTLRDQPGASTTDVLVVVGHSHRGLDRFAVLVADQDHQAVRGACRPIAVKIDGLLPVDVIDRLEVRQESTEGIADLLASPERRPGCTAGAAFDRRILGEEQHLPLHVLLVGEDGEGIDERLERRSILESRDPLREIALLTRLSAE
jgi:hypothetical protein